MWIVSGCPRSGTSLMMDCMRVAFGDDRILGKKFPQERRELMKDQQAEESDHIYAIRQYLQEKGKDENREEKDFEDMNPNGFWECQFSVQGVHWNIGNSAQLSNYLSETDEEKTICKIVSQGLVHTDPVYVDKIVYMIRHPRAVAKSHERLKRGFDVKFPDGKIKNMFDGVVIHTPEMYINVTIQAARWLLLFPEVPVLFMHFDDLVEHPDKELARVEAFLGGGKFKEAANQINPRLRRSAPQDIEHVLWEDAEAVYEMFLAGEYEEILEYASEPKRPMNRTNARWPCPRAGRVVVDSQCQVCYKDETTQDNMRKEAERRQILWQHEPCLFECGMNPLMEPMGIEESIRINHWRRHAIYKEVTDDKSKAE
jgi:hypothetical protein